ncbi:cell adhesion molecule DSCAML1-like isoform X2 [Panonychus citri]|uniref:cell adhesion molecule DSCAML1-like isoform X2 n=1 Tax=Panonychus citri TaxID=50023 RepID=UPI002307FB87|nr:cell adhesion molecule DSCAML1-like isoform X2 [Panonychus citri]
MRFSRKQTFYWFVHFYLVNTKSHKKRRITFKLSNQLESVNMFSIIGFIFIVLVHVVVNEAQESPKVNPFSPLIKPVIGGRTSFACQSLTGSPPFTINWFKDGQSIRESNTIRIRTDEESSMLSISAISSSHSGNYSCKISNRFGSDSFTSELTVEGPPQWIEKPENVIKSILGEKISVKCSANGYPKPNIQWKMKKDNNWIYIDDKSFGIQTLPNELIFHSAKRSHAGIYGCSAKNDIKPDLWIEFEIIIDVMDKKSQR